MNDAITPEKIQAGLLIKIVGRGKHVNGKFNEADYIAVRVTPPAHCLKSLDLLDQPSGTLRNGHYEVAVELRARSTRSKPRPKSLGAAVVPGESGDGTKVTHESWPPKE